MALAEIVDISEIIAELGLAATITDANRALLAGIKHRVENAVRRHVGHNITQPPNSGTYIEFHPRTERQRSDIQVVRLTGDKVHIGAESEAGEILQLDQPFTRSITEVREDYDSYFGQEAGDFPNSSILTEGTDYYLEVDSVDGSGAKLSKSGHLIRKLGNWPSAPGTVKVTYVAGFTAAELDGEYSDIKEAVIGECVTRFGVRKSQQGSTGAPGPVKSESIGGEYSVTYDTSRMMQRGTLLPETTEALRPYVRWAL